MKTESGGRLTPEKRSELFGISWMVVAILLGVSLGTYQPTDPSFFHQTLQQGPVQNLAGRVGAEVAAFFFEVFGFTALLLPVLLLLTGWRRFWNREGQRVVGRGVGAVVVMVTLPALLQALFGVVSWRGVEMSAGGLVGSLVGDSLERFLNPAGTLVLLGGGVLIGFTMLIQSTLGGFLIAWRQRLLSWWDRLSLAWARHRERRTKEQSRRRVMAKHLERAAEKKSQEVTATKVTKLSSASDPKVDLPLRVEEKEGQGGFSVRKVKVEQPKKERREAPRSKQKRIAFADEVPPIEAALPPLNLLQLDAVETSVDENELVRLGELIRARCAEFGVEGNVVAISPGPVVTIFEFQPAPGVKVSQIVNLQDDLALALKAEAIRIERLPGRSTLGIEVPNKKKALIHLGHLLSQGEFRKSPSPLTVALGTTLHGEPYFSDLAGMPHLLVAGATGSGKSVGLQSMITSILYKATRDEVQFIFIDPKRIELGVYANIPHLKAEVVVEPKKAANALRWAVSEMERRYRLLAEAHVRSLDFYNRAIRNPEVRKRLALSEGDFEVLDSDLKPLPYYVIVIDELADLMMVVGAEVEASIARLAQMARAVGIHLIVATQRPSVDVLTGTIKANFPCRLSYATVSRIDSRTILDQVGAEKLLGRGDALFMPPGTSRVLRLHGAYVTEQETAALVRWMKKRGKPDFDPAVLAPPPEEDRSSGGAGGGDDPLFDEAARLVVAERQGSASFLQRRMRVGFSRAARLIDMMEQDGLLGPPRGSKPREVLVKSDYFAEVDETREEV